MGLFIKVFLCSILILPGFVSGIYGFTYTKTISSDEIQKKINSKFPLSKKSFLFNLILSDPKVILKNGVNRIGIDVDLTLFAGKKEIAKGSVYIHGQIDYLAKKGEFFLKDPRIDNLTLQGINQKIVKQIESMLELVARNSLNQFPIYRLNEEKLKHRFAKSLLKSIKIHKGQMEIELQLF